MNVWRIASKHWSLCPRTHFSHFGSSLRSLTLELWNLNAIKLEEDWSSFRIGRSEVCKLFVLHKLGFQKKKIACSGNDEIAGIGLKYGKGISKPPLIFQKWQHTKIAHPSSLLLILAFRNDFSFCFYCIKCKCHLKEKTFN